MPGQCLTTLTIGSQPLQVGAERMAEIMEVQIDDFRPPAHGGLILS